MTATEQSCDAFTAFETQLRTLCLQEFPCGIGSWLEASKKKKKKKTIVKDDKLNTRFSITLKDYGAGHEKIETLEELVTTKKSPWNLDYSWSNEAKELRELAVRSPWLIDDNFVMGHFKSLRIADKGVTEIDEDFLQFTNLEELTLSANNLRTVASNNLPQSLKVLELCANRISNLADLCIRPPPLIHLGLGHNKLTLVDDYITGEYWPHLLSLDMSFNNLCDLMDIVRKLQSLPKLRNLILNGNPLALVPGYRGYTIDSIKKLDFLDDIPISADEKHHFKGLAKRREYILDEAKMRFEVQFIKGVPMPEELQNPEDQPEYPIVTKKYFVQFMFLEDRTTNAEIFQILHDQNFGESDAPSQTQQSQTLNTGRESGLGEPEVQSDLQNSQEEKHNVNFAADIETVHSQGGSQFGDQPAQLSPVPSQQTPSQAPTPTLENGTMEITPNVITAPVNSGMSTWTEEMEINWVRTLTRDDLLSLRNFLQDGMDIAVMEEKVLSFPVDQAEEGAPSPSGSAKGKKDKKDKKDDKPKEAKNKKDKPKDDGKAKKKGKKGEPEIEMTHMPPEYTTIATFHVPLEDFLEGDFKFENVYIKKMSGSGTTTPCSETPSKKRDKDKKKPSSGKKKDAKDARGKSPKPDKKGADKGGKGGKSTSVEDPDAPPPPPPPLEVHVSVELLQWKTARDSLKTETQSETQETQS